MGKSKPTRPYPSFPLTSHPNGQWCKKIRGRIHFFGVWADPEAALQRYLTQAADLHAGREARMSMVSSSGLTVKDIGNEFLNWQKEKLDAGEIGLRWFDDCRSLATICGPLCLFLMSLIVSKINDTHTTVKVKLS